MQVKKSNRVMIFKRLILLGTWQIVVFLHICPHKILPTFYLIFPEISSMHPTLIFDGGVYAVPNVGYPPTFQFTPQFG